MSLQRVVGQVQKIGLIFAIAILMVTAPVAAQSGGGLVKNVAPDLTKLTLDVIGEGRHHVGFTDTISGEVFDANSEADIASVEVLLNGALDEDVKVVLSDADPKNGILEFSVTYTYNELGTYAWTVKVTDEKEHSVTSDPVNVDIVEPLTIPEHAVNADGSEASSWGGWSADPGDQNVAAKNFIKLVNSGVNPKQGFVLAFDEAFVGEDEEYSILTENNIQFGILELASDAAVPDLDLESSFAWQESAPGEALITSGTLEANFGDLDNIVYVSYRILQMPAVLADQVYSAGLTISAAPSA